MATEVTITSPRPCDICKYVAPPPGNPPADATYDVKTKDGPWANVCDYHRSTHAASTTLGTGLGQRLILKEN